MAVDAAEVWASQDANDEYQRLVFSRPSPRPYDRTLPAERLVEFWCQGDRGPHLLGVVYASRKGPLWASCADHVMPPEQQRQANSDRRTFTERTGYPQPTRKIMDPAPCLPLDGLNYTARVIRCRCRTWAPLTMDDLRQALAGGTPGATRRVAVRDLPGAQR